MFFSSVLPSEASPSPRPPPRGCDRLPYTCLAGGRAWGSGRGGETAGAARAAWLPAPVHIRMSDDSCHGCSWHGSSCQGQGAWPHAWMHSALPRGTRLTSTGLQLGEPAWPAVARACSGKQGSWRRHPTGAPPVNPGWGGMPACAWGGPAHQSCPGLNKPQLPENSGADAASDCTQDQADWLTDREPCIE